MQNNKFSWNSDTFNEKYRKNIETRLNSSK